MNDVKKTVAQNEEATKTRKDEIEAELSEVQPILDSAKQVSDACPRLWP